MQHSSCLEDLCQMDCKSCYKVFRPPQNRNTLNWTINFIPSFIHISLIFKTTFFLISPYLTGKNPLPYLRSVWLIQRKYRQATLEATVAQQLLHTAFISGVEVRESCSVQFSDLFSSDLWGKCFQLASVKTTDIL